MTNLINRKSKNITNSNEENDSVYKNHKYNDLVNIDLEILQLIDKLNENKIIKNTYCDANLQIALLVSKIKNSKFKKKRCIINRILISVSLILFVFMCFNNNEYLCDMICAYSKIAAISVSYCNYVLV